MISGQQALDAGVSLVPSIPAVDEFPIGVWERLRAQVLAKKGVNLLRYASNRGDARPAQGNCGLLVRFQSSALSSGSDRDRGGMQQAMLISATAVLNPGEARVDRRSLLSADPKSSYFGRR